MQKFFILLIFINSYYSKYYTFYFVGFGAEVPKFNRQFLQIKPDDQPYLGIEEQSDNACTDLTKRIKIYKTSDKDIRITLVGISQGGLVARHMFMTCEFAKKYIKRIITQGTPNLGINKYTFGYENEYSDTDTEENPTKSTIFNLDGNMQLAQGELSIGQSMLKGLANFAAKICVGCKISQNQCPKVYKHDLNKESNLMQFLNLEFEDQNLVKQFQKQYESLEIFVTIAYSRENIISIKESPSFGSKLYVKNKVSPEQLTQKKESFQKFRNAQIFNNTEQLLQSCTNRQDYDQCVENVFKVEQNLSQNLQEFLEKFYLNEELYIESFHSMIMKRKYVKMFYPFKEKRPQNQDDKELWEQRRDEYYDQFEIPLANTLDKMYQKRKFIQCAVTGKHLEFPSDIFYDNTNMTYQNFDDKFKYFTNGNLWNRDFKEIVDLFNCSYYINNLI